MEKWKDIVEFEHYQISTLGRVRSKKRDNLIMRGSHSMGYPSISLCKKNKKTGFLIHRLVATHFISNPKNKATVNHKNGIKTDNRVENLEWATHSEQNIHASKMGLKKFNGEHHSQHKLTDGLVIEIRERSLKGDVPRGVLYGVSDATIKDINNRKSWKHI